MEVFDSDMAGNPIGELQEYTQKNLLRPPIYDIISEQGPAHAREFVCTVKLAKLQETGEWLVANLNLMDCWTLHLIRAVKKVPLILFSSILKLNLA